MTDDDTQPEDAEPGDINSQPANGVAPERVRPSAARPQVRSGLAHKRNPVLATAGDIAVGVRRLVFRDKLALFLTLASVALAIAFFVLLGSIGPSSHGTELPISRVVSLAEHKQIARATLLDHDSRVEIALKTPTSGTAPAGTKSGGTSTAGTTPTSGQVNTTSRNAPLATPAQLEYWAAYPVSGAQTQGLLQTLSRAGVVVNVDQQSGKAPRAILVQFLLPILLLVCLFALFTRIGADGGAGGIAAFSDFTGKGRRKGKGKTEAITFDDVAGAGEAVAELREIRDYLADPSRYLDVGAAAPKGVLLVGPPGTGKTLLAKAVGGGGRRVVLLAVGRGLRRVARRRRRGARARPVRQGAQDGAGDHLHRRARRRRAQARRGHRPGQRRARADAEPAARRDGRLRRRRRSRRDGRHQPPRHPRPRAAAPRPLRPPGHGRRARRARAPRDPASARRQAPDRTRRRRSRRSRS